MVLHLGRLCIAYQEKAYACFGSLIRVLILDRYSRFFFRILALDPIFRVLNKLEKILVSLGVLILHFIIMIAFYEMPEFERITDPYQPELADRSYNLTFCLSDYQEHSFDSCPGRGLAYSLGVLKILSCTTCMQNMLPWSNSMGRLHLSNSQCDWTRKSYEAHNCKLQVATQLCVEQEKKLYA